MFFRQTVNTQEVGERRLDRLKMESPLIEQNNRRLETELEGASSGSTAIAPADSEVRGYLLFRESIRRLIRISVSFLFRNIE
jgi:hypothetical protein